jgi:hypothetical protein
MSMRKTRVIGWCASAAFAAMATACGGSKPLPVLNPLSDVSGHWQLNAEQSDNAADKIAAGMPGRDRASGSDSTSGTGRGGDPDGGRGMSGTGGGGMRGRGGGGGRGGRGEMGGTRQMSAQEIARRRQRAALTIDLAKDGSADLDVRVTAATVRLITHDMLDTLALKTDGGKNKSKVPGEGESDDDVQITTRAQWSDGWLVVSREVDGGGKITETYLRSNDGQRLYVVVQIELPRFGSGRGRDEGKARPIEFRRVYDPVTTSS